MGRVHEQEGRSTLEGVSESQGGGGNFLRGNTTLTQAGVRVPLGRTPRGGTWTSFVFTCGNDTAYDNAKIEVATVQQGHEVIFSSFTISPAKNAAQSQLVFDAGNTAAEYFQIYITLQATVPVAALQWEVCASGRENLSNGGGGINGLSYQATFVGPGLAPVFALFPGAAPLNETGTYQVVMQARIESSGVDPVGASMSTEAVYAWENTAGTITLVPVILSAPNTSTDAALTGTTALATVHAGQASVEFQLPGTLDASTVTAVEITLIPLETGG